MSAVIHSSPSRLPEVWRQPLLALLAVLAVLVGLFWNTWVAMVGIWERSGTFAHCYLVAPISVWLVWRLRDQLFTLVPRPSKWVAGPMLLVAMAWLMGDMASVNALTQFAVTAMLVLAVPLILGWQVARRLAFPLLFLFFMVPFGEFLLPWLMEWTADFTVAALRVTGIPVYREGLQFVIPSGTWSVVEACSGVRYLIASAMVGSLFAYLNYTSTKRRLIFGFVALAVPLVANWLRAYMIVMLGHLSGNKLAVGVDHLIYGWVFFGIIVGIMFWLGGRWSQEPETPDLSLRDTQPAAPAATTWLTAALGAAALALPVGYGMQLDAGTAEPRSTAPLTLTALPGTTDTNETPPYTPPAQNPTATAMRAFGFNGGTVQVHVAYYRQQRYGAKMASSDNHMVKGLDKEWQQVSPGLVVSDTSAGPVGFMRAELLGGSVGSVTVNRVRLDVRQTYWVDGQLTASPHRATLYGLWARLLGRGDDGALITLYTEGQDKAQTSARLDAFLKAHMSALERQLVTYRALR